MGGGGDRGPHTDKHLPPSTFTGQFFKKRRHSGFGIFVDILSMEAVISAVLAGKDYGHLNYAGAAFSGSGSVSGGVPSLADQFRTWIDAKLIKMICDPLV
jgi:hypothetical protein